MEPLQFKMPSITLKNIPADLNRELKSAAYQRAACARSKALTLSADFVFGATESRIILFKPNWPPFLRPTCHTDLFSIWYQIFAGSEAGPSWFELHGVHHSRTAIGSDAAIRQIYDRRKFPWRARLHYACCVTHNA